MPTPRGTWTSHQLFSLGEERSQESTLAQGEGEKKKNGVKTLPEGGATP